MCVLDTKASYEFQDDIETENVDFQLVPLNLLCANITENIIQTWENNFKANLPVLDPKFI